MNECTSSRQQLANIYKQLNNEVVLGLKEWLEQNQTLYQKISDCCEDANSNLSDINDILDEYIEILVDCCGGINGKLRLILTGIENICIECIHIPVTPTTTEEHTPTTTAEPTPVTTGEPGPEECDAQTEVHEKGSFYPYGPITKYLGEEEGLVTLDYEVYKIPDRFVVFWNGEKVIDTGYHGLVKFEPMLNDVLVNEWGEDPVSIDPAMTGSATFTKDKAEHYAYIYVYAPLRNTAFNLILSCPYNTSTTSTSTTTTTTEEEITTTSSEETDTTTARPCTLDVEVLFPPQPIVTTSSTEEPVSTTSTTCGCPGESCGYGLLYNQPAVQDERNIANTGWHVPTYEEAKEMLIAHGGSEFIDGDYKYTGIEPSGELQFMDTDPDYWYEGAAGTNTTCFSARGGSYRYDVDGGFYSLNNWATWWLAESGYWMSLEPTVLFSAGNYSTEAPNTGMGLRLVMDNPEEWYCGMLYTGNNGDTYSTVKIGDQVWLGENLRETKYRSGANITEITDNTEWVAATEGALCAYDNDWLENICMDRPCYIPDNYTSEFILFGSISFTGGPPFTSFIATLEDACQAVYDYTYNGGTFQANYDPAVSRYYSSEDYWRVNDLVYDVETCELVATGYYIMHIQGTGHKIVYIVDGMIVSYPECPEITTTSSTEEPVTTTTEEPPIDAFIFEIESGAETIELPLHSNDDDGNVATYDAYVYWDYENYPHTSEHITTASASHTYSVAGTYVVVIEGTCQTFATRSKTDTATHPIAPKITRVLKWGNTADFRLLNFYGCVNLTDLPHDVSGNPYGSSEGVITCAANINTFENFLYSCINYKHKANGFMFVECPSVITFKYTFGSSGITDVDDFIFEQNELVQSFYGTFSFCSGLDIEIPAALFSTNSAVIRFDFTFANSAVKGIVPDTLFAWCPEVKYFIRTFRSTLITGLLSDHLFWGNSKVESFEGTFHNCLYLGSSAIYPTVYTNNLFVKNTAVVSFQETFHICQSINNQLPADLFKENTKAENFGYTFGNNYLVYGDIPATLFSRCPKAKYFNGTFSIGGSVKYALGSGGTGTIPVDLFASNPDAETFELTFRWQGSLLKVPNGLFRNNLKATNFNGTFVSCPNLKVGDSPYTESYPFSAIDPLILGDTEATAALRRFTGKVMIFTGTFGLPAWQGAANTRFAPELWDPAKYDYISATYAACFIWSSGYNPYTNYASIPSGWK